MPHGGVKPSLAADDPAFRTKFSFLQRISRGSRGPHKAGLSDGRTIYSNNTAVRNTDVRAQPSLTKNSSQTLSSSPPRRHA